MRKTLYLFEDAGTRDLYRILYPEWPAADCLTWAELVGAPANKPEQDEAWLQSVSRAGDPSLLPTLRALRESLILTEEHVRHAFAELPSTPKNRELRRLFELYLRSPLSDDLTTRTWSYLERVKSFEITELAERLVTVRAKRPSYLFEELTRALTYSPAVGSLTPAVEDETDGERSIPVIEGSPGRALIRLASAIARRVARGISPERIVVPFQGSAHDLAWLRLCLHHHRLPFFSQGLPEPELRAPSESSRLELALRRDTGRPLKERLHLAHRILGEAPGPEYAPGPHLDRLLQAAKITREEHAYLTRLAVEPVSRQSMGPVNQGIAIVPFDKYPVVPGRHVLAYSGNSRSRDNAIGLLLAPLEIETLYTAGFPLLRPADEKARERERFELFAKRSRLEHRLLFTSVDLSDSLPRRRSWHVPELARDSRANGNGDTLEESPLIPLRDARPLSATQLEAYARCPSQYLFSNRLRLRPLGKHEEKFPLFFGQLTHRALESYFSRYLEKELPPAGEDTVTDLIDAFRAALEEELPTLELDHPFVTILTETFKKLAIKVPPLENQLRDIFGPTRPTELEMDFTLDLAGVVVRGKIDRMDRTREGANLVLDYKTGSVDFTPEQIARGEHFQALLYLLAAESMGTAKNLGLLFYDLKKGELRRGILHEGHVPPVARKHVTRGHVLSTEAYQRLRTEGGARITEIAGALKAGDFRPRPAPGVCDFCDYPALCRKGLGYA